jgi:hypothetical protein
MQEKTVNGASRAYSGMFVTLAWLFMFTSWFCLGIASKDFVTAAQDYGVLAARTFLDAGVGYFGLFSFGTASIAMIFARRGGKLDQKSFQIFRITLLISILFLTPILFSMVAFLL